jgi:hypothetical protein
MDALTRLIATEDIKQLKARYFRAVDLKDAALLRSVFMDDAIVDYRGSTMDPRTGINAIEATEDTVLEGGEVAANWIIETVRDLVSVHHASVPEIEITSATTATGIWPMVDHLRFPPGAPVSELVGYGHYHETYRCVDGQWKIERLRLTRLRVDNRVDDLGS